MEKLNNLLNREDYLKSVNEGKIGDFIKSGVRKIGEKVAQVLSITSKKIQNMITTFDSNGNALPVVSPQAIADHFANSDSVSVIGSYEFDEEIKSMGGAGCKTSAIEFDDNLYTDDVPDGAEEYINWVEKGGYKNSKYYKNLQTLKGMILSESKDFSGLEIINEKNLEPNQTISYQSKTPGTGTENFSTMSSEEFRKRIIDNINYYCVENKRNDEKIPEGYGNILIFGAPGIGKSTIPNDVVKAFNKESGRKDKDKIALISVNCANINPGEFLMPAFPKRKDILRYMQDNIDSLDLNDEEKKIIAGYDKKSKFSVDLINSNQYVAGGAPAAWLPVFRRIPGRSKEITMYNYYLNVAANGGMMATDETETFKMNGREFTQKVVDNTGSGGIILLDEFLRAKPSIFAQLMNFLLDRRFEGWELGSKWFIIACSNRPCDDNETAEGWDSIGGAGRDRFCKIFNMDPNPEEWKAFMRRKGFDETLISFIFDETTKKNGQYWNWYRTVNAAESGSDSHKPITPRNWFRVHAALWNFYIDHKDEERFKNGYGVTNMTVEEIEDCLRGIVDDDYLSDLLTWLHQNCASLDLDAILTNPDGVPMPMLNDTTVQAKAAGKRGSKSIKEGKTIGEKSKETNEENVINTLRRKLYNRYVVEKKEPTDEELTNVMIWLGKNFKDRFNLVCGNFIYQLKNIVKKYGFWDFHKFGLTFWAAFPEEDSPELYNHEELNKVLKDKNSGNGRTSFYLKKGQSIESVVKGIAEKEFPWRIRNNELIPITQIAPEASDVPTLDDEKEVEEV